MAKGEEMTEWTITCPYCRNCVVIIPHLARPISDYDFSTRTANALKRNGIWTHNELEGLTDKQLLRKAGLGIESLREIRQVIPNIDS